ncbi:MAG: hypothetical protein LBK08_02020 [Treponema sp.]|jgi:hypothetical protein|nr:hypothetical protein [Treponema sp.]
MEIEEQTPLFTKEQNQTFEEDTGVIEEQQEEEEEGEQIQEEEIQEEQKTIFEGLWITNTKNNSFATFEFTNNTCVYESNDTIGAYFKSGLYSGKFEFTKNTITLTADEKVFFMYYSFQNNNLVFETIGNDKLLISGFEILTKNK